MLRDGWEIDAHTLTHPDLTTVDAARLRREVAGSRRWLRHAFGVPVDFFAYPSGRYNPTVEAAVRAAGYMGATTTQLGQATRAADPLRPAARACHAGDESRAAAGDRAEPRSTRDGARRASRPRGGAAAAPPARGRRRGRRRAAAGGAGPGPARGAPGPARPHRRRSTPADVDAALTDERSVVVAWLGRGTLHLVGRDDYPWLLGLTAPTRSATSRRRLAPGGRRARRRRAGGEDRRARAGRRRPADPSPAGRAHRRREGIRTEGQATPHLLMLAALRGRRGARPAARRTAPTPSRSRATGSAPRRRAELAGAERDAALAELARRYLAGHGPAAPADLAAWSGLPLRDARAGLKAIASELAERDDDLVDLAAREPAPDAIPARLLPAFDPYLLGWKDRAFAVPAAHAKRVHPGGGMLRATATVDGLRRRHLERAGRRGRARALRARGRRARRPRCRPTPTTSRRFVQAP